MMRSRRRPTVDYLGNYASGFVIRNEKLDFDRELYLEQFLGTHIYTFMSSVAQTQMFEQVQSIRMFEFLQRFVFFIVVVLSISNVCSTATRN